MPRCLDASGSVRTRQNIRSACCAPDVQIFWPFTTNSSPTISARVRSDARSEPEPGREDLGKILTPLILGAVRDERRADHLDAHHPDDARRAGPHHLLVHDGLSHDVGALPAVLLRPAYREVTRGVHLALPRLGARDPLLVGRSFHRVGVALVGLRDVLLQPGTNLALEGELF